MTDWRQTSNKSNIRASQVSGRNSREGVFSGMVDTASGETQAMRLVYGGGERSITMPMPFESTNSWIRSIPQSGTQALLSYRSDTEDVAFLQYINEAADKKLSGYAAAANLYRPLQPGEHEISSSGGAQIFFGSRPLLDLRAGVLRSWIDQDKAEVGQKAPTHTRQLWQHRTNEIGDEERFGAVRRPKLLTASALAAGALTSSSFSTYPIPDFSLPGGVPAAFSLAAKAISDASAVLAALTGSFKKRPFAKEYLRVLKNPLSPIPPFTLIDIREGQVFDDKGFQLPGPNGAYKRAEYKYYTPLLDSTSCVIDELGNVNWSLSLAATSGWSTFIPFGSMKLQTGTGITMETLTNIETTSILSTSLSALTTFETSSLLNMTTSAGVNYSLTANANIESKCNLNWKAESSLNMDLKSGVQTNIEAGVMMNLKAPIMAIGGSPSTPMVLGTELSTFLSEFINVFITAAPAISLTGNLGAPVPLSPAVVSQLTALLPKIPLWISKTITVSP